MLKIFNTATKQKETFEPLNPECVTMYTCGMTVYSFTHIGHLKSYLTSDIISRYLRFAGYSVRQVMNVTDVGHHLSDADEGDDKLEVKAKAENKTPWDIAREYELLFFRTLTRMNIDKPNIIARASEHVPDMVDLIKKLEENGYTYMTEVGLTYDTAKFKDYATFAGLDLDNQKAGHRVAVDDGRKAPWDFALWIVNKPNHIMKWNSPWGVGYPGWHIECSAMSRKYLGEQIDIHTGGVDHIKIHHTNEIAQAEGASGKRFVKYWVHTEFLNVDGTKMSKSLGNLYTLDDLEARGYSPVALRYMLLKSDYKKPFDFTWASLDNAQNELIKIWRFFESSANTVPQKPNAEYIEKFRAAMDDSFNTPNALTVLTDLLNDKNVALPEKLATAYRMDAVLALDLENAGYALSRLEDFQGIDPLKRQQAELMLVGRDTARKEKNWAEADRIRNEIDALGFVIVDAPSGSFVRVKKYGNCD